MFINHRRELHWCPATQGIELEINRSHHIRRMSGRDRARTGPCSFTSRLGLPRLWLPRGVEVLGRECDLGVNGLKLNRGELAEAPSAPAAVVGPFDPGDDREA